MKWDNLYHPKTDGNKQRKAFHQFCSILDENGGNLLSEYIDSHIPVQIQVLGLEDRISPSHLQRTIDVLMKCRNIIEQNGDTFISFSKEKTKRFADVHYLCHEDNVRKSVSINACVHHYIGKNRFFTSLRKNGDKNITPYYGNEKSIWIRFSCGHSSPRPTTPNKYVNGRGCPICTKNIIIPKVNDFFHEHSELLSYFPTPTQTIGKSSSDCKEHFELLCPDCGVGRREMTLANLCRNGFSCPYCSNRSSYFNRFMHRLLIELGVEFISEKRFSWCHFLSEDKSRMCRGIYDFVIENQKLIIEMDGGFHDKPGAHFIDQEKDRLAQEHDYTVLRIDCRYKNKNERFRRLIDNINKSGFPRYYAIKRIDLDAINAFAMSNEYNVIVDLWNEGYSSRYIQTKVNCTSQTVASYLSEGNTRMDCQYSASLAKSRSKNTRLLVFSDSDIIGCFYSVEDAKRTLCSLLGLRFDTSKIMKNCRNDKELYHSLKFNIAQDEEEYVSELKKEPLLNKIITDESRTAFDEELKALKAKIEQSNDFQSKSFDGTGDKYTGTSFVERKKEQLKVKNEAIKLWNDGFSIAYISSKIKAKGPTIRKYLKEGMDKGDCNYSQEESRRRGYGTKVKVQYKDEIIAAYVSIPVAVENFDRLFNKKCSIAKMSSVVNQQSAVNGGLQIIEFQNEEEYVQALKGECLLNDLYKGIKLSENEQALFEEVRKAFNELIEFRC